MNDFFVGAFAQNISDLAGPQAFDAGQVLVAVVRQAAGDFRSVRAAKGHDVALGKAAIDFDNPRRQQAAAFPLNRLLGPGVQLQ